LHDLEKLSGDYFLQDAKDRIEERIHLQQEDERVLGVLLIRIFLVAQSEALFLLESRFESELIVLVGIEDLCDRDLRDHI
jgi:hypothetical protein